MQIVNTIKPISSVFLQNGSAQLRKSRRTFQDILQDALKNSSGSRPPKIERTGVLVPCDQAIRDCHCKFKLETDSGEYFLSMSDSLAYIAKRLEWDEVIIKGFLDSDESLFEVEKISLAKESESNRLELNPTEPIFVFDSYKHVIDRRGKLELAPEYVAS